MPGLLRPYSGRVAILLLLVLLSNAISLLIPKIIQKGIDDYSNNVFDPREIMTLFLGASLVIFVLSYVQAVLQTYISEKVAFDLRTRLLYKISQQNYHYIRKHTSSQLLTNITSDTDGVKMFISQAIVAIISSVVLIAGAAVLLININTKLGLIVLIMVPIILTSFFVIFKRMKGLFRKTQGVIDWLNKVIHENILGASLVRVLNAQHFEFLKFTQASGEAKNLGISIVRLISMLVPVIVLTESLAQLAVLGVGGHYIIIGGMTLGEFAAFNSYIAILIFPLLIIGFTSNVIARAAASHQRLKHILDDSITAETGTVETPVTGKINVENVCLAEGADVILKNISFKIEPRSRTAIIGPTAAGKTQLLNLLIGLLKPTEGTIYFDDIPMDRYRQEALLKQTGIVFQDSILFNLTLRENIAFNKDVADTNIQKAITTAELKRFVARLPDGLNTPISERGSNLSGGQKQRVMLARALAINPTLLLLDDFTARVDMMTEKKIGENLRLSYPNLTLISITQKINPVKDYDQIILLMEGEIIAKGKHEELITNCPEYIQIYRSQQSTMDIEEKI